MADDDSKKPRPVVSPPCTDRLVVPESAESVQKRKPFEVDGIVCVCGKQFFFVGIAEKGKACSYCGSSITAKCQGCANWTCIGCLEKAAIAERERLGAESLANVGRQRLLS
jgi:hypothetical protein